MFVLISQLDAIINIWEKYFILHYRQIKMNTSAQLSTVPCDRPNQTEVFGPQCHAVTAAFEHQALYI